MPNTRPLSAIDAALARLLIRFGVRLERVREAIGAASLPRFATTAPGLVVRPPFEILNPDRIYLGRDVKLGPNSQLKPITYYPGEWMRHPQGDEIVEHFTPTLRLGDRVTATSGLYVAVFDRVDIEDDVMFATNVFISDGTHASVRGDVPYKFQGIDRVAPVRIGRGAWIGQNSVISPGVKDGQLAIIGANSVVTHDVPEGCVAVGAPARIVRRWDPATESWQRTDEARQWKGDIDPDGDAS